MAKTVQDYLNIITSEYQDQPDFNAVLTGIAALYVYMQQVNDSMIALFDLSTPPAGNQLDIIGQWVGVSRNIAIPITGVYFTWQVDGISYDSLGWGDGIWADPDQPANLTTLPDDAYLTLINAKIAANNWDGTTEGAYIIFSDLFPNLNLLIQDNQNMNFIVAIQGTVVDALTLALLTGGYLPLKPEGVRITEYIVPVDTNPLFAWNVSSAYLGGWGVGSWGVELPPS